MNTTTRRIATLLTGAGLAAAAFAGTSAPAFAGKVKAPQPLTVAIVGQESNHVADVAVDYTVPVAPSAIQSVTCSLDGVPLTYCGSVIGSNLTKQTEYWGYVMDGLTTTDQHNFSVTVVTTKGTYAASKDFVWVFTT